MFPPQIHLLHLPSATPFPPFSFGSINDSVIVEDFVFDRNDQAPNTNHTVVGYPDSMMDS